MKIRLSALLLILAAVSLPATAAQPGEVDLTPVTSALTTKPTVNIRFGPAMMSGFAETMRESNPEMAGILASVTGLRLMVFEDADSTAAEPEVSGLIERLNDDGWSPAIQVRDDGTQVDLYLMESSEFVNGLTLLLRDGSDVVFANIHGDLDPVMIGKLIGSGQAMSGFDLDGLMEQIQQSGNDGDDDKTE